MVIHSHQSLGFAFRSLGMLLLFVVSFAFRADAQETTADDSSSATVATVTIKGGLAESVGQPGIFGEMSPNLASLLRRLKLAAGDQKVKGVVLRIRHPQLGRGRVAELRAAIAELRSAGKVVIAQLESVTTVDYLLAIACDEIVLPESGTVIIPGIRAEVSFYKGLFDLLGVEADMMQVGDFKGAAEPYTRTSMSPAFRQQYEGLIDDLYNQMIETIADGRGLDQERVRELIDVGVFTPAEALAEGLIDVIAYEDELEDHLAKRLDVQTIKFVAEFGKRRTKNDFSGMLGMMKLFEMMMGVDSSRRSNSGKKIAVIYANGVIMPGKSAATLGGGETVGSDTLVKAIKQAEADKTVVGVVLRVNSPGGSSLASDLIWRALQNCEKPTIASMGDTAASGGYYISMGCDQILAEPGTLTGSIGVVGGKFAVGGLYKKVGLTTQVISRGKNSGVLALDHPFTDSERAVFRNTMQDVYAQFVSKAASGRNLPPEKLEKLAGGRVWTGRQAAGNGLVDKLGTLGDALSEIKQLASIPAEEKLELLVLPRPTSFLDQLLDGDVSMRTSFASTLPGRIGAPLRASLRDAQILEQLTAEPGLLLLPHRIEVR